MEFYDFPFSWECHDPNWRTPSFFRGVGNITKQYIIWAGVWEDLQETNVFFPANIGVSRFDAERTFMGMH